MLLPSVVLFGLMTLSYFSLRVSPVFARETQLRPPAAEQKKETNRAPDEQLDRQKERLIEVLKNKQLYLNPELRLSDLAQALDIRPYRVSEILNRGLQTTFYDLINGYRISRARELLLAPDAAQFNLLGIAMESGFKSKSVFNDVFKKSTGMTPSQFRNGKMTESRHSDA
jgi:AraC-like DNA-binding protein